MKQTFRTFCVLAAVVLISTASKAQDLIVTAKGDTINAKITKVKNDFVHFVFDYEGEIRQTLLPVSENEYKEGYFDSPKVTEEQLPEIARFSRFRIGLLGGWSYLTGKIPETYDPAIEQYFRKLKSGSHYGGDFDFFISELIGVGLRYRAFRTIQRLDNVIFFNLEEPGMVTGLLKNDIRVQFIGPTVLAHVASANQKVHFHSGIGVGYVNYQNNAVLVEDVKFSGESFGLSFEMGVDFKLDKNLAIGIAASSLAATLSAIEQQQEGTHTTFALSGENRENLSRVDVSLSLKWYH